MYLRVLSQLEDQSVEVISSEQLGASLHLAPAQIRQDLSYFGRFGRQNYGYDVGHLSTQLRRILGLERLSQAGLDPVGRLGRSVADYRRY